MEGEPLAGRQCESKPASPAWKLVSNHWPGVFPVFKGSPVASDIDPRLPEGKALS
ncbi:hypothetical protein DGI_1656 [Megalodesulfovibrio gigas DSM 1382 = ATCC 19364]|uniref:Uncharacterized protein n=1 Tax=Megalodesulfovibrio gigas (strain ATCC 19364 / DSM 1382 / NCIMB 9332 / VKM B-1759) TaxID=1121448 RepID=T2GBC7_MEGG1|nr:hypothetical protein DGI_1656 [Megalodesulfovibrio gigas DSM 1382 = ATCC 19364]